MVMHIGACPVGKADPVNGKIAFEDEEEYEAYGGDIHDLLKGYPGILSQFECLRKQIKK
jgi:antibiotic biosynthesis monooxygenase (ABM) superfamily enzyme